MSLLEIHFVPNRDNGTLEVKNEENLKGLDLISSIFLGITIISK